MHKEILTKQQIELLPLLKEFSKDFGLVGGTAIALHIGHRRSLDFDLFTQKEFNNLNIKKKILKFSEVERTFINDKGEYTVLANKIKITFFQYPFALDYAKKLDSVINLPDLLTLAAMKAYALGMRAKWKDYTDLYFVMKKFFSINEIIKKGRKILKKEFNEKLFRSQLAYFKDIDYSEKIIYLPGFKTDEKIIKKELIKFSLS